MVEPRCSWPTANTTSPLSFRIPGPFRDQILHGTGDILDRDVRMQAPRPVGPARPEPFVPVLTML